MLLKQKHSDSNMTNMIEDMAVTGLMAEPIT